MQRSDSVLFQILRHRLWTITQEAGLVLGFVSGSPVASEAHDCSTTLLDANGDAVIMGPGHGHAIPHLRLVKHILQEYADNPGIEPGDMYICNDPYISTHHQNCVDVVAPIHWKRKLVAWAASGIHQSDVGGPVAGQVALGAQSIYQEPIPMPPLRIVERGRIRKDIEEEYLIRSRTRDLNALDLKAKIAANVRMQRRIQEVIERYGVKTAKAALKDIVSYTEARLRARLRELTDGTWRHTSYLDYFDQGKIHPYRCQLSLTKDGDCLVFDFTGSSSQAPAVVNCTRPGLESAILSLLLALLCYDIPWSPTAVMRVVSMVSEPGTLVHAAWPAGVSKSSSAGMVAARVAADICMAKMFAASGHHRENLIACSQGFNAVQELAGRDQRGERFAAPIIDIALSGGFGARSYRDGVNTGGNFASPYSGIANVETYELRYPILYLHRRQQADSGGAGKYRGGTGISVMYTPHDVDQIETSIIHGLGHDVPSAFGLFGGYPGTMNQFAIKRDSDIWQLFADDRIPSELSELDGRSEIPPSLSISALQRSDVYQCLNSGGGGYGDPLDRAPDLVLQDVLQGLVSVEAAGGVYGVVIDHATLEIEVEATRQQRGAMRARRLSPQDAKED